MLRKHIYVAMLVATDLDVECCYENIALFVKTISGVLTLLTTNEKANNISYAILQYTIRDTIELHVIPEIQRALF